MNHIGKRIFCTGIDTGVGKTLVSAVLVKALGADYWKPVQCGDLENSDSDKVKALVNDPSVMIHPEAFRLAMPASPHRAAAAEGRKLSVTDFHLPDTSRALVVEGAGGVLAPLNEEESIIDLAAVLGLSAVVVCRHYLGSLNHSLLTVEAIRNRGIPVTGLVFSGDRDQDYEEFLSARTGLPVLFSMTREKEITPAVVRVYAEKLKRSPGNGLA